MSSQEPAEELPDEADPDELDEETSLAFADPDDYTQNQRVRGLYKKREAAYDALTGWPGRATKSEWAETKRGASHAAANYAMDCLELADRLDEELSVDGPMDERFEEKYGNIRNFATYGGERLWEDEHPAAGPVSCRLVISACDRFLADVGLAGKIDPGLDDDLL